TKSDYYCGESTAVAGSEIDVSGLDNGRTYAVAIAAVDKVGNVGKLSALECASPAEATDFYESYRGRGGQAGGGLRAMRPWTRGASMLAPVGFGSALLLFGGRRLARRKRAARAEETRR